MVAHIPLHPLDQRQAQLEVAAPDRITLAVGQVVAAELLTAAQREVVEVLRLLDEQGVVSLSGAGGAEEYVS